MMAAAITAISHHKLLEGFCDLGGVAEAAVGGEDAHKSCEEARER